MKEAKPFIAAQIARIRYEAIGDRVLTTEESKEDR